jgi:hypothetical protein
MCSGAAKPLNLRESLRFSSETSKVADRSSMKQKSPAAVIRIAGGRSLPACELRRVPCAKSASN